MELNAQIIASDLGQICIRSGFIGDRLERGLRFPVLYRGEKSLKPDRLYLARAKDLPDDLQLQNKPALLAVGESDDPSRWGACDFIIVKENISLEELLERVSEIFAKYGAWETDMQRAIIQNEPLRRLGELSEPIFENPIQLYDSNLKCIFSIVNTGRYTLPEYYSAYEDNTYLSLEEVNLLKVTPEFIEATNSKVPLLHESDLYRYRALSKTIFFGGKYAGRVLIDEIGRAFTQGDFALIDVLADFVLSVMMKNDSLSLGRPKHMDTVLFKLLSHKLVDEEVIESVLGEIGWSVHDAYFCMTIEPTEYDRSGNSLNVLAARISAISASECYLVYKGAIVFVFNLTKAKADRRDFLKRMLPDLRDSMLKAGISTLYSDFKNLYYYCRQTNIALELGKQKDPTYWFYRFDDYALDHIVSSGQRGLVPEALWPTGLVRLREHDREKGTNYMEILKVYLECNMSIADSTRRLYLHRNTFLYRLERIKEILQINLEDFEARLLLMIVLR